MCTWQLNSSVVIYQYTLLPKSSLLKLKCINGRDLTIKNVSKKLLKNDILIASRDETILQYIDILQYLLQYNTV